MTHRFSDAGDSAVVALEMRTGGARALIGIALLAIAVCYATAVFLPVAQGPGVIVWASCYGILIASWLAAAVFMIVRQPGDAQAMGFWLPLVRAMGTLSNLLAALSIWLFLPAADAELRGFMATLYIWYVVIQVMAETSASSVSASAIILVLGSLAFYELAHPARYSIALGTFALLFAASMLSFRRLIRRALMEALKARLEAERANEALDVALRDVGAQRDAIRRFLGAASHDLQQPVQAARLFFDRAIASDDSVLRNRAIEGARRAFTAAQTMLQAMLEHLRLEAGVVPVRPEAIPLAGFFAGLALDHEPQMESAGIAMKIVPSRYAISADPGLLRRLFANLLSNAAIHSKASRLLLCARKRGGRILIHVADNGRGIRKEAAPSIFDEFTSNSRGDGNFGLGLSSARRLARAMGAELRFESRWRNGACFVIDAPLARGETVPGSPVAQEARCEAA